MLISGVTVTTLRDGIDQVDVVARAVASERGDLGRLGDMVIYSNGGPPIQVSQIARIQYEHEEPIFRRRNRDMTITVRADVKDGVQAPDVTNRLRPGSMRSGLDCRSAIGWKSAAPSRNWPRPTPPSRRCFRSSAC